MDMAGGDASHITLVRLFELSKHDDFPLTAEEREHLHNCEECQYVLTVFARQFGAQRPLKHEDGDAA